jgi:hypothetical protein
VDLIKLEIPASFVEGRTALSWREVRFGIENELLDPHAAVDIAVQQCAERDRPSTNLLELAAAREEEPTAELIDQLAESEASQPPAEIRRKWLYLVLAWTYEHRSEYRDPLGRVEEVYADFGYPEELAPFVRYMPLDAPDLGSREANEGRLLTRWKEYLDYASKCYGQPKK